MRRVYGTDATRRAGASRAGVGRCRARLRSLSQAGVLLAVAAGCGSGCASGGGPGRIAADPASTGVVLASDLLAPGPSTSVQTILDARTREAIATETHESSEADADGVWTVTTVRTPFAGGGDREPTTRVAAYRRRGGGAIDLLWSRSVKDTDPDGPPRLYVFDPPLPLYPRAIRPGEPFEAESKIQEREPRDESRVAMTGRAIRRVRLVSREDGDGHLGGPAGVGVEAVLRVEVGPAAADRIGTVWIGGAGGDATVPREEHRSVIRVFGLPFKDERWIAVPAGGAPEPR